MAAPPPGSGSQSLTPVVHPGWWLGVVAATPGVAWVVAQWLHLPLHAPGGGMLAWALLGSPLLEELVYRLAVQSTVARWAKSRGWRHAGHWGNAGAALALVLVHLPSRGAVGLLWWLPALVLGELYRQTHRVWPCVALHAWFNTCLWLAGTHGTRVASHWAWP